MFLLDAQEADKSARAVGRWLADNAFRPGDRIAIALPEAGASREEAAHQQSLVTTIAFGALRVGVVPVMVNPAYTERERWYVINDSQAKVVIDTAAAAREIIATGSGLALVESATIPLARAMHYTSGTTGNPKGVYSGVLDYESALSLLNDEVDQWQFTSADRFLVNSPLAHSAPLRLSIAVLSVGGSVIFPGTFDAGEFAACLAEYKPTTTFLVPSHLQRIQQLGSLPKPTFRLLLHAGAACPPRVKRALHDWVGAEKAWEFYGSTEGQFSACSGPEWEERPGTAGRARRGRQLEVEDNVIWAHCPDWARFEYWNAPDKTYQVWREDAFSVGDLGYLDDDGYLFLEGRREDLIISGGVNVYPAEVEAVLMEFDGVVDIAVFGIDDEQWGHRVCAAIVGDVDDEALAEFARDRLAPFKRPKDYFHVELLPTTPTGKVRRLDLPRTLGLEAG